jgi:arylsulfatase A-like enzyme
MIKRREFLKTMGAAVGAAALPAYGLGKPAKVKSGRKPNIIYILADDLGYGDLGCYGQKQIKTPRLDKMAAEGMKFTRHYSGSTVCAPSRCSLMTGLHTGHCFIRGNGKISLRNEDVTVAELLKDQGYTTALIGKWGCGQEGSDGIPRKQGYDYFFGYLDQHHAHNYYPTFLVRNEERVPLKNVVPGEGQYGQGKASKKVEYSHDLVATEALDFVKRSKDEPFFLYLALTIPHANNEAKDVGMEVPSLGIYEKKDWPGQQRQMAAMVSRMDGDVGKLLDMLKELGIDDNTIVFFTSDNGPHREGGNDPDFFDSNGPLRGTKRDLYDGGIRVPLIARWPGKIEAGSQSEHVSAFWDFLPTAVELAGAKSPKGIDGISMVPELTGKKQKKHEYLYWEFNEKGGKQGVILRGRWKGIRQNLVEDLNGPIELYDLNNDIGEETNVADKHPDIVAEIAKIMKSGRTKSEVFPLGKKRVDPLTGKKES